MEDSDLAALFAALWDDIPDSEEFYNKKPLLAHYTSIQTLREIVRHNEIWFSNPLLMNDLEELRFGILEGARLFRSHSGLKDACATDKRYLEICAGFDVFFDKLELEHVMDYYTFCLSEHQSDNQDGLLSMWRGYGGNGNGAAIVIDVSSLGPVDESPFILAQVHYGSADDRRSWINGKLDELARIIAANAIPDKKMYHAAYAFFERLKIFSLFSKHQGFREEREWRVVYMRERDEANRIEPMLDYAVTSKGIEPKLKFKIGPVDGVTGKELSLETLVDHIILGPALGNDLAVHGVRRMLQKSGHPTLADKLIASSTPFRAV